MSSALSLAISAAVLVLVAVLQLRQWRQANAVQALLQQRLRERFVVTLLSGESFDGLLMEVDDKTVVMKDASLLRPDNAALAIDGEMVLRRDAIAYMQRPQA